MKNSIILILAFFLTTAFTVDKVVDGDTVYFDNHGVLERVRLACADTPECGASCGKRGKSQYTAHIDIGFESYKFTKDWIERNKKHLELICRKKDRYGRNVCYIMGEKDILNHDLIAEGYAVADERYCNKEEIEMQKEAKMKGKGLWAFGEIESPAKFRKSK